MLFHITRMEEEQPRDTDLQTCSDSIKRVNTSNRLDTFELHPSVWLTY